MEIVILCCSALALILFPVESTQGAIEGIRLCGKALIPALLPFLVITRLLGQRLPVLAGRRSCLGISGTGWLAILMSFIGGYPTGVATGVCLYQQGRLSKKETEKLIPFCNNSGPGFFVGVLGAGVFGSVRKALILYGIHVFTALWGIIMFPLEERYPPVTVPQGQKERKSFPQVFQEALGDSCNTMIRVCGLVILFSVLRGLLCFALPPYLTKYMGLLELSSGLLSTGKEDFVLWAMFMGWGGLCVHMQAMSIWQGAGLTVRGYFPRKLLHSAISGLCAIALETGKWYIAAIYFIICPMISLFYKNRGRKKEDLAL